MSSPPLNTLLSMFLLHWVLNEQLHGCKCHLPTAPSNFCYSKGITITAWLFKSGSVQSHPIIEKGVGMVIDLPQHISETREGLLSDWASVKSSSLQKVSYSHFRIHSLITAKAFYCDNRRERGEGGVGVCSKKTSISVYDWAGTLL